MSERLHELEEEKPTLEDAIGAALLKLNDYYKRLVDVPAYYLSMSEL
jgi:hypothetical protein